MKEIFAGFATAAVLAVSMMIPTQGFAAYTCSNPAICIAVCGKKTCGKLAATNPDIMKMDAKPKAVGGLAANADASAGYTCSNPAICIAVCGKKTC